MLSDATGIDVPMLYAAVLPGLNRCSESLQGATYRISTNTAAATIDVCMPLAARSCMMCRSLAAEVVLIISLTICAAKENKQTNIECFVQLK